VRTYGTLAAAGVHTVADAAGRSWDDLVKLLDQGGYVRYDFRTATRLQQLARVVEERFDGTVASLASVSDPRGLEEMLDALPGWGPTTVHIFLRELRGVWPGAQPPLDERALRAARQLHIPVPRRRAEQIDALETLAGAAGVDVRDLECALVRYALAHREHGRPS
jgi:endonuclease III